VWFQDETRAGQKGRVTHRWFTRGERPPGLSDHRFNFGYIFGAVRPGTDDAFALVMPEVSAQATQIFLDEFAKTRAPDEHAVLWMDRAGFHVAKSLIVPKNLTIAWLPSYSPQLNPIERLWLHLKARYLSHRLLDDTEAVMQALCGAWTSLIADAGRIASICSYPWIVEAVEQLNKMRT
jgi:transposase